MFSVDYQYNSSLAEYSSHAVTYRCFPWTINTTSPAEYSSHALSPVFHGLSTQLITCRIFLSCCHLQVFSKDYQHNSSPVEYSSHAVTYRCFPRTINTTSPAEYSSHAVTYRCFPKTINTTSPAEYSSHAVTYRCFPRTINTTHHLPNIPLMLSPTGVFQGLSTQSVRR